MKENMNNLWSGWQKINENMFEMMNKSLSSFQPKPAEMESVTPDLVSKFTEQMKNQQQMTQDFYKKFFDAYTEFGKTYNVENFSEVIPKEFNKTLEDMSKFFKESINFNSMSNIFPLGDSKDVMSNLSKQWIDNMQNFSKLIPNSSAKGSFNHLLSSFNLYNNLYSFWSDLTANISNKENSELWNKFMANAIENYKKVSSDFAHSFLPEELQAFIINPLQNLPLYQQTMTTFFGPWLEGSDKLQKNFLLALKGDNNAYMSFLKDWSSLYQNSFSKPLNMPMVGSSKVALEKSLKNLDSFIKYIVNLNEFLASINNISVESMKSLMDNFSQLLKENKAPKSFMEFFKLWSSTNEKAFEDLFATETFSRLMNDTLNAGYDFKLGFDDLIQDQLSFLPFPNKREINSVEKVVSDLRRKVKQQNKQIEEIKEQIESLKGGANK